MENRIKYAASLFAALLVMMLPLAAAQEAGISANSQASAQVVTAQKLKMRQFGESVEDFFFGIKAALTFNEESKVELLQDRNAELQSRQQMWVESKNAALAQFNSSDLTAEEKQEIMAEIQEEHHMLIREHIELTEEIREIEAQAKAEGNAQVEEKASAASSGFAQSRLGFGLDLAASITNGNGLSIIIGNGADATGITSDEAVAIVESELGFEASAVRTEVKDGARYYVVTGAKSESNNSLVVGSSYEAWVSADTGMISFVSLVTMIEARAAGNLVNKVSGSGSASAETGGSAGSESGSEAGTDVRTESKTSASSGSMKVESESESEAAIEVR